MTTRRYPNATAGATVFPSEGDATGPPPGVAAYDEMANERIVEQIQAFAQIRNIVDQFIAVEGNNTPRNEDTEPSA